MAKNPTVILYYPGTSVTQTDFLNCELDHKIWKYLQKYGFFGYFWVNSLGFSVSNPLDS